MVGNYEVVTLCGSTKFKNEFIAAQRYLTLNGCIVLSVGLFGHADDEYAKSISHKTKAMLDDMHRRKIDMSDTVFVINKDDYIGESTAAEIAYAKQQGKKVTYMFEHKL